MWLSVDPMSDKYPSMSPYNYCANNPVILVDPDGREIEGFSVDKNGQVQIDQNKASKDAIELYNAMSKTETGAQAFVDMVNSETKINVKITDEIITGEDGEVHGKTTPKIDENNQIVETKNGFYKEVDMLISTADLTEPDRFTGASREEKLNAIGTHERVHLSKNKCVEMILNQKRNVGRNNYLQCTNLKQDWNTVVNMVQLLKVILQRIS